MWDYKMMSEIFDIFRKCPNRLNFLQGVTEILKLFMKSKGTKK